MSIKLILENPEKALSLCRTEVQRRKVQAYIQCKNYREAARAIGLADNPMSRTLYEIAHKMKSKKDEKPLDTSKKHKRIKGKVKQKVSRYFITNAQNATPVNSKMWESVQQFCSRNKAELIVIPNRYHNPTSRWSQADESQNWYAAEVVPHLLDKRISLNANLVLLGDIRILPTAVRPTSGMETLTGEKSAILGHNKLELVTIPTPQNSLPKVLMTTGTITVDNYTDSKSGKKGEHHHTYGGIVVEVRGDAFYFRQVTAGEDGTFYDLNKRYTPNGVESIDSIPALVMGDLHERFADPGVVKATFDNKGSIVNTLNPETVVLHDVLDFYSQNHHHRGKVFTNLAKAQSGDNIVEREIDRLADFIRKRLSDRRTVFVPSNHPDALARWVEETDWRGDPLNAEFYLKTALAMVQSTRMGDSGAVVDCPFAYWMRQKLDGDNYLFPARDETMLIEGISVTDHGDKGPNGARGSIRNFGKLGVKSIIGHSHTPGIMDGVFQVGTSSRLRLEYNSGPSSWLHCHALIYPDGKRTLLAVIDGRWRA